MKHCRIFFCLLLLLHYSCNKETVVAEDEAVLADANTDNAVAQKKLQYSDSVFYVRGTTVNYFINPVRKPRVAGYFKAIPLGLTYDSITGRVNINKSETGLRYEMYYINTAGKLIDSTQLIVSGIDYADGIYEFSKGQTTALPIYAANPSLPLPCDDDDDDDDDDNNADDDDDCEFDERDLDDDGTNDIPGANSLGFKVNRQTAVINLSATLTAGALGTNPQNGANEDFLFYYRLSDATNGALQQITVRLYYYNTKADIPDSLINELNARKAQARDVNNLQGGQGGIQAQAMAVSKVVSRPKRPPLIVLVAPPLQTSKKN